MASCRGFCNGSESVVTNPMGNIKVIGECLGAAGEGVLVDSKDFNSSASLPIKIEGCFTPHQVVCGLPGI
jgi:hypothetical protein